MSDQFLCRSVYIENSVATLVECSFGDWSEVLLPNEARQRASRLMLVAATASVEANTACTMTKMFLEDDEEVNEDKSVSAFYTLLKGIQSGRGYEKLDGMSPAFGQYNREPLVSINWIPGRPLIIELEEARLIALGLFGAAEEAETDNCMRRSCLETGVSNELFDRIFAKFAKYRAEPPIKRRNIS